MAMKLWATMPFFHKDRSTPWADVLAEQLDIAQAAEDLGFEGVVIPENHFQNYVTNPNSVGVAAAVASRTTRLRIHPGVFVLPYYHPLLVASWMGFLDALAPGRFSFGVARGGGRVGFDRLGIPFEESLGMYTEALEILQRAWVEDDLSWDGKYYQFPKTTVVTKSRNPLDIWVASQSAEGIARVAEGGLNLETSPNYGHFEPHGDLDELLKTYDAAVAASGKPRGEVMVLRHVWLGDTEEQAMEYWDDLVNHSNHYMTIVQGGRENKDLTTQEARLGRRIDGAAVNDFITGGFVDVVPVPRSKENLYETHNDPVLTTPDKMIQRFKHYESIGIDHLLLHQSWGQPGAAVIENMEKIAREVMPALED
ncbi:LLM class flavin-dependent oxidoreductase [Cnuibacter physcomitrellae]|uniref:LLM class flavin-dependent oxidoreductase n=1 Tax=Cnuibacter physcomitrellae TaxID=1619308 RepID=UPI00217586B3|nr:LLM class flavin-dependent oxidoreductase [Cnuibacter physcomitrellae]MCS5498300.1 LLM class flavin-dependent oxidoreductase [Cnuibacter physcomitrellae]